MRSFVLFSGVVDGCVSARTMRKLRTGTRIDGSDMCTPAQGHGSKTLMAPAIVVMTLRRFPRLAPLSTSVVGYRQFWTNA